jgi:hypothetical protein
VKKLHKSIEGRGERGEHGEEEERKREEKGMEFQNETHV